MKIDVCVATYRRPDWLRLLLGDLAQQQLRGPCSLRVIVVDNDPQCSARPVVEPGLTGLQLLYLTQPLKNISLTRNLALDHSRADWVAFVDDDERVPPQWLQSLLDAQQRYGADAVFGPVEGQLPASAPAWVKAMGFFTANATPSGTVMQWGSTNNALLNHRFVAGGARFDPRFGLTGGEDTQFFFALAQQGARMVWCREALISEPVAADRMTLRWLLRRHFRGGQSYTDIVERPRTGWRRLVWSARCAGLLAVLALLALCSLPFNIAVAVRFAAQAASNAGKLSTVLGYRFQEYR